ncbi:hypothetical protein [Kitasatospora viridis]|uniref:HEAT repeat protein n=1 Tax=Kitasatospora viridis TaxID=281105 RepID=A0A561SE42_9ACTN|nr:hypothetical protein [Kitasatospora viridis]TWF73136.1 hypothetical protein FHX73_16287 [Kitasatospora viridis]
MTTHDDRWEPDEHLRFAAHLARLRQVPPETTGTAAAEASEAELVGRVLADPDRVMARSAVLRHLDRRAAELLPDPAFVGWSRELARAVAGDAFLLRRLREWSLVRAIALELPWQAEELLAASDWLQLTVATGADRPAARGALALLAEGGRTRRIRAAARAAHGR